MVVSIYDTYKNKRDSCGYTNPIIIMDFTTQGEKYVHEKNVR